MRCWPWAGAGSLGLTCDEYNGDNFDHAGLNFIGGANINCTTSHARPISARPVPPGTPRWGGAWKKATRANYLTTQNIGSQGSNMSYRDCYLDLDPTYRDRLGRPLLRMTFDYKPNEERMSAYVTEKMVPLMRAMGRSRSWLTRREGRGASCPTRPPTTRAVRSWAAIPGRRQ
jgi:gluconate 2-dehydrogenase alpha chain